MGIEWLSQYGMSVLHFKPNSQSSSRRMLLREEGLAHHKCAMYFHFAIVESRCIHDTVDIIRCI